MTIVQYRVGIVRMALIPKRDEKVGKVEGSTEKVTLEQVEIHQVNK